jgi:hypothetical protein
MTRTVCWFSCGAASAYATHLTLLANPDAIVARCVVTNEHPDNDRFAKECAEKLFGKEVLELRSEKYSDCWQVWEERRFLNGPKGALCTVEMKKKVRQQFEDLTDIQIFGFTWEERGRAIRFLKNNPEVQAKFPLIESRKTKADCFDLIRVKGMELPTMYRLGYANANCIGCVKGGAGYWNKIRRDFPETFERMSALEEQIGASCIKKKPLRFLHPKAGRHKDLQLPDCGLFCGENS